MASMSEISPRRPSHSSRPIGIRPTMSFQHPGSTTPPYTSAEETISPSRSRPLMMPRPTYPPLFGGSPNDRWINPRHLAGTPQPQLSPSAFGSSLTESSTFNFYPQSYPSNPYMSNLLPGTPPPEIKQLTYAFDDTDTENPSPSKFVKPPPRPPNAWIIYRSEMLRAIADGQNLPKLDAVMAENGVSSGEATEDMQDSERDERSIKKKKKVKKPKKGSKEPTAGMLSLGKGKTGRGIPQADVSKLISLMWAREEPEVKKKYEKQSELQKIEHQRKYPDYKFQPLRKADRMRMREEREREKIEARKQKLAEKQAGKPKRKQRTRVGVTPYSAPKSRTASGSAQPKEEQEYGMYPFPMPHDSLPALASGELPFPEPGSSKAKARRAEPAPPLQYPPTWGEIPEIPHIPDIGSAYAVPYIFEPIPIPGEEFNMDLLKPLPESEADADALAALWCAVEEDTEDPSSGWDMTSSEAMQAWSEIGTFPQNPSNVELSSSIAEQIARDWTANMPLPPDGVFQPILDPSHEFITVPYVDPRFNAAASASTSSRGAFLSANQPLSPVEPWSTQSQDSMPFRSISTGANRLASSTEQAQATSPESSLPRHVSSTAFPSPLSVENAGWTDRSVSFSAFAAQAGGEVDDLLWEEDKNIPDNTMMEGHKNINLINSPAGQFEPVSNINTSDSSSDTNKSGPPERYKKTKNGRMKVLGGLLSE